MAVSNLNDKSSPAVRLEFLDGLRGVAAAMVVVHHLTGFVAIPALLAAFAAPNPWVAIFITLSGFCLYLPAAGRPQVEMPRPFWEFLRRRARRIVPAWYASLALCMLVGWFFTSVGDRDAPNFLPTNVADVLTHLSLTHSMTAYSGHINGPGYTLGTECQLYVLMIVLVAVAARAGWSALFAGAILVYFLPGPVGKFAHHLFSSTFGLPFIVGMVAARTARRPSPFPARPAVELSLLALTLLLSGGAFGWLSRFNFAFACWAAALATGAACVLMARRPLCWPARLLSSAGGRALGGFSYSLYLTHFPLLALAAYIAAAHAVPPQTAWLIVFVPALSVIFGFAYLFSLVFERPFLNSRPPALPAPPAPVRPIPALMSDADAAGIQ